MLPKCGLGNREGTEKPSIASGIAQPDDVTAAPAVVQDVITKPVPHF